MESVMSAFRTIEIDLDVHKRIEAERQSFAEAQNDILRRKFGLSVPGPMAKTPSAGIYGNGRAWSGKGLTLEHGTQLRMEYNGKQHIGEIDNGEWLVEGIRYRSPSAAAGGAARTKNGSKPSLDGWKYWFVRRPGENDWTILENLRRKGQKPYLRVEDL
jgi:hypothetical protein